MSRVLRERADALLRDEHGTVHKEPGGKLSICLIYPNSYSVGMSSLGFQGIYRLFNLRDDVVCERCFLPDQAELDEHLRTRTELFALESKRPLATFDVLAFSVSFENDYPNIVRILTLGGIAPRAVNRSLHDPLVVMGGVCAFCNPEPVAELFDLIFTGEGECVVDEFVDDLIGTESRAALLERSLTRPGRYVPLRYDVQYDEAGRIAARLSQGNAPQRITRVYRASLDKGMPLLPAITTPNAEFSSMWLLEAMRGCPWNCAFCLAGHVFNPPRMKSADTLKGEIETLHRAHESARVGLIGPSLTDYPHKAEVLSMDASVDFSITSLRASAESAVLTGLMAGRQSVAIAPEAGTERLRRVINKKITEEDILESATLVFAQGVGRLRLYFMVGLPTETEEDIRGIVELVGKIRALSKSGRIDLTASTFVPKPHTPFQWHPMLCEADVTRRITIIRKGIRQMKGVALSHDAYRSALTQGVFSIGGRRVLSIVEAMAEGVSLKQAARQQDISIEDAVYRQRPEDEVLPWDFLDVGQDRRQLYERYQRALDLEVRS